LGFCHKLPFDRSSLTHWRQRLGEEQLATLLQESLSVAHQSGALASRDLERVVVDTPAKGDRPPERCPAVPSGAGKAGRSGPTPWRQAVPEVSPGGQARCHHGRPLQPCPPVQAGRAPAEISGAPGWAG